MTVPVQRDQARLPKEDKDDQIEREPPAALVLQQEPVHVPEELVLVPLEHPDIVERVELGHDHTGHRDLAEQRVRRVLGLGEHAELLFAVDVEGACSMA